jgi:hypothetical protein
MASEDGKCFVYFLQCILMFSCIFLNGGSNLSYLRGVMTMQVLTCTTVLAGFFFLDRGRYLFHNSSTTMVQVVVS